MISIPSALSGARDATAAGGAAHKGARAKFSLDSLFATDATSGSFASLFGQQTAALAASTQTSSASASTSADIVTQLTAQLQSGTPLATIVDQIAQSIGNAAAKQLQGTYTQSDVDRLRTSITQTIANALLPPSNAPPGTAAQQAATLAARLQKMVESLARDAQDAAGQQNELSGNLLDAVTAKDIPAQQKTAAGTQSVNTQRVSQVVRSLISSALSAVSTSGSSGSSSASVPSTSQSVAASATVAAPIPVAPVSAPQVSTPAPQSSATPVPSGAAAVPSGSIGMSNAPDLLARMLVRAAGADAPVNSAADTSAAVSQSAPSSAAPPSPSLLASRFAALLTQDADSVAAASSSNASGQNGASTANDSGSHAFAQTPSPAPSNALFSNVVAPATSMAAQLHDAIASTSTPASPVDANAVIEQLVKGITMRTDQQGTSEIRLQLQPENLGAVTMKLTVSGSQVNATVVAQSADVRNTIAAGQQDLARSLSDAGLTLSGFSVDVSGGDAGNDQNKDRTAGFGRRFTVHEVNGAASTETADDSSSGPQLLGSSSLELFNYLA